MAAAGSRPPSFKPQATVHGEGLFVTCGVLVPFPVGFHFSCDGADDPELGEKEHPLRALKFRSRSSKMVDTAQADLRLLGLQNHHVAIDRGDRHTGGLVGTPADRDRKGRSA